MNDIYTDEDEESEEVEDDVDSTIEDDYNNQEAMPLFNKIVTFK